MGSNGDEVPASGEAAAPEPEKSATASPVDEAKAETHPLHSTWAFWMKGVKGKQRGEKGEWDCGTKMFTFSTVEEFWRYFNNLRPASSLPMQSDYYLFKEGIMPMFEDTANSAGGEWRLPIGNKNALDDGWLYTVLGCIGETLDPNGDEINGVAVSIRKREDRVSIWTKGVEAGRVQEIGRRLRVILKVEPRVAIKFSTAGREISTKVVGKNDLFKA